MWSSSRLQCTLLHPKQAWLPLTAAHLGCDNHNLLADLDTIFVAQNTRQQDLGAVADCIDLKAVVAK